jgi:hypothetical protein
VIVFASGLSDFADLDARLRGNIRCSDRRFKNGQAGSFLLSPGGDRQPFLGKSIQPSAPLSDGPVPAAIRGKLESGASVCYILSIGLLKLRGVFALTDI